MGSSACAYEILSIPSEAHISSCLPRVRDLVYRNGFAVIQGWDNSEDVLRLIAENIGDTQCHIRANERGIVGETPVATDWNQFAGEYFGVNNEEFNPHTDGSFLQGVYFKNGHLVEVNPPRMLLLQMAQPAMEGGANLIIDAKRVVRELIEKDSPLLKILTRPCVTVSRDNMISRDFSVFRYVPEEDKIRMTFRFDKKVYARKEALEALRTLNKEYFLNPEYQVRVPLAKGQIIVVDNWSALHARENFVVGADSSVKRKLRRVWISEDCPRMFMNVHCSGKKNRSLSDYDSYSAIPTPVPFEERTNIECGITLPEHLMEKARCW